MGSDEQAIRDLAYSWTNLTVTVIPLDGGEPNVRTGSTLTILRRQDDGGWAVVRGANLLALSERIFSTKERAIDICLIV